MWYGAARSRERVLKRALAKTRRSFLRFSRLRQWFMFTMPGDVNEEREDHAMDEGISKERAAFLAEDYRRGFIEHCQFEAATVRRGYFESRVRIEAHHRQQDGFIHAGVMATMADHTAGYAAFTTVPEGFQILTIEFKVNFLRPAHGDLLVCCSKVIREGSQIIISESEVFDVRQDDKVFAAKAMVTLMAVKRDKLLSKR